MQRFTLDRPRELVAELPRAVEALENTLHDNVELYEIKAELGEPIKARLSVVTDSDGIVIGDAVWIWDGTRWGAES
jgi:hypothetical protein